MSPLVLHHYPASPYAEKIRAALGYKRLSWQSVETPMVMPKPDLVALTGGYRKAPVLQIGRDIYCDTALICRTLDRLHPETLLVPPAAKAGCAAFAALEQTLFFSTIPTVFQPAGLKALRELLGADGLDRFARDRAALFTGGSAARPGPEFGKVHFLPLMNALDQQLAASPFLLGEAPTLADFCAYHPVWFILGNAGVAGQLDPFRSLLAWAGRMQALGHGSATKLGSNEAIALARASSSYQPADGPLLEPDGIRLGSRVAVSATDYGVDAVVGSLVHASVFELVVRREDERAGELRVHFPRAGFKVVPASAG